MSGVFVEHKGCPDCGSRDNLAIYLNEHEGKEDTFSAYCWGCSVSYQHNDLVDLGVLEKDFVPNKESLKPPKEPMTQDEIRAFRKGKSYNTLMSDGKTYRGLNDETMKFYGHLIERDESGRIKAVYYPETRKSVVVGYKSRHIPKKFGINNQGLTGIKSELSGQVRFKNGGGKYVIIVGGEEDKVAAQIMFRDYQIKKGQASYARYPVVSPTTGEVAAYKQIAEQYEWLDSYEQIIICMDNDEAGESATEKILEVLPAGKVKVMKLTGKDPNEMLIKGNQVQFISDFFNAKPVVSTGIKSSTDGSENVIDFLSASKIPLPPFLHRLQDAMRGGIRSTGAIVNIIGDTSIGKSLFTDTLVDDWIDTSPLKPTIISLERTDGELMTDLYSLRLGVNLTDMTGEDAIKYLSRPEVKEKCLNLIQTELGEPRFHIIDERDGTVEVLQKQVDRAFKQFGSRLIIFDPLTDWLRSLPVEQQEDFMMWQKLMKKEGIIFINVLHTRKSSSESRVDGFRKTTEYDALGTGSFVQSADINIVINRNKMAKDSVERNTTIVDMPKCRGGITGTICELFYDFKTRQLYDKIDWLEQLHGKEVAEIESKKIIDIHPEHVEPEVDDNGEYDTF